MSNIFANRSWSPEETARLTQLLDEGDRVLSDITTLRESLKDTVASISEDYDIPKRSLNKAIRAYHKQNFNDDKESVSEIEEILTLTGKV